MTLQAIIFDVDGTLADTEFDGHRVAFNAAFAAVGLPWEWDEARYERLLQVTGGKERIRHYAQTDHPGIAGRTDFEDLVARIHALKTARYVDLVNSGQVTLRPGIARILNQARAEGVPLAIATTTTRDNVDALLTATVGRHASSWFCVIGAGDIVPAKKPAPDIYTWVLRQMRFPPGGCLAVEDSGPGLAAATAAGIPTLVTPSRQARHDDLSAAVDVRDDLSRTTLTDLRQLHARAELPARAAARR